MENFFLILMAALIAGALGYLLVLGARNRRKELLAVAQRLGLLFESGADSSIHRAFGHSVFNKGRSREATNNIFGRIDLGGFPVEVRMGDYQYVTGSGKSRQTHRLSFACFLLPFVGTPDLLIRTEGLGDKVLGGLGFDDIDFESEEFSRRFWVKSGDKRYAYDLVHPRMMEFFMESSPSHVEVVRDVCLILEGKRKWDPEAFERAPGWFEAFIQLWPQHIVEQLETRQGRIA